MIETVTLPIEEYTSTIQPLRVHELFGVRGPAGEFDFCVSGEAEYFCVIMKAPYRHRMFLIPVKDIIDQAAKIVTPRSERIDPPTPTAQISPNGKLILPGGK